MWTELDKSRRLKVEEFCVSRHKRRTKIEGYFVSSLFLVECFVCFLNRFDDSSYIFKCIACLVAYFLIIYLFSKIPYPCDTKHIFISEPLQITKKERESANRVIAYCGDYKAMLIQPNLEIGDTCRLVHIGFEGVDNYGFNRTGFEEHDRSYVYNDRFALTDDWFYK